MKFTFSWLKDYLETDVSLDEVATNLTEIGLEVEEITNPKEDLKEFIIAKILSSKKHPGGFEPHYIEKLHEVYTLAGFWARKTCEGPTPAEQ